MKAATDRSYRLLAARCLDLQANQLAAQFDGVRKAKDVECVHRARVASRRLRAALAMFEDCFPPKKARRWRKSLRRLTRGLGPARDKDVHIEFLCDQLTKLTEARHVRGGVALLLERLEQERAECQADVFRAVDRFDEDGVSEKIRTAARKIMVEAGQTPLQSAFVFRRAQQAIAARLVELRQYEDSLDDPKDQLRHHAMRIAAKRLRYTMELVGPAYEGRLDESVEAARNLQVMLGAIHDCDVWTEQLSDFKKVQRKRIHKAYGNNGPFAPLKIGIEHLQRECRRQRKRVFGELGAYWGQLRERDWLPREANAGGPTEE